MLNSVKYFCLLTGQGYPVGVINDGRGNFVDVSANPNSLRKEGGRYGGYTLPVSEPLTAYVPASQVGFNYRPPTKFGAR